MSNLNNIEPKKVFQYFEEISSIPRGSKKEEKISNYLVNFAKDKGLEVIQDKALNVIIKNKLVKAMKPYLVLFYRGIWTWYGKKIRKLTLILNLRE